LAAIPPCATRLGWWTTTRRWGSRSNLTEVKARFRELARQSHPDKTAAGGAAAQGVGVVPAGHTPPPDFVQVREAYDGILAVLEPHPDHKEL
jgi:hypothetical protein